MKNLKNVPQNAPLNAGGDSRESFVRRKESSMKKQQNAIKDQLGDSEVLFAGRNANQMDVRVKDHADGNRLNTEQEYPARLPRRGAKGGGAGSGVHCNSK